MADHEAPSTGTPGIIVIGLVAIALIAAISLVSWFLGVEQLPEPANPTLGEGGDAFASLTTGGVGDSARVVRLGNLPDELNESSGVAVSRGLDNVIWSHNDGDPGMVFALRPDGTRLGTVHVEAGPVEDWEDMALAPCPAGLAADRDCIYLADTGDNALARGVFGIDILPEPTAASDGSVRVARRVHFVYPDGTADTEALAISSEGDALLVTKGEDGASRLYTLPVSALSANTAPDRPVVATMVTSLSLVVDGPNNGITGAAMSPDGRTLAVRNHHAVFLLPIENPGGAPILCEMGPVQPQGEALDFLDADRLILTSERIRGRAPIIRLRCP